MFPALYGDCLLVTCEGEHPVHILIDTGFSATYRKYLRPRLLELAERGERLSLVVITHIDEDHIRGSLTFFRENGPADQPKIIGVDEVWHNGYRNMSCFQKQTGEPPCMELLQALAKQGIAEDREEDSAEKISVEQGATLAALLLEYGYSWNTSAGGREITVEQLPSVELEGGGKLTVLSPTRDRLKALEELVLDKLAERRYRGALTDHEIFDSVFESVLAGAQQDETVPAEEITDEEADFEELSGSSDFAEDRSVTNGSSIAFLLEYGGKRALFLADSHPSVVKESLKRLDPEIEVCPWRVDLLKVSHHGSAHNTSPELLEIVDADRFLISTNGKKFTPPHPALRTMARIVTRKTERPRRLIFNYRTKVSDVLGESEWQGRYAYDVEVGSVVFL